MTTTLRLDAAFQVRRMQINDDGFLDVWGVAARRGVLAYEDGQRIELVTDEALETGAQSMIGAPVTLEHPPAGEVTPETARRLSRGTVLDARYDKEAGELRVHLRVTDQDTIEKITEREVLELSPGYTVTLEEESGEHADYGAFDAKQVARQTNHLALTRAGRDGPESSLRVDSLIGTPMLNDKKKEDEEHDEPEEEETEDEPKFDAAEAVAALDARLSAIEDALEDDEDEDDPQNEDEEDMSDEEPKNDSEDRLAWFKDRRRVVNALEARNLEFDDDSDTVDLKAKFVEEVKGDSRCDGKSKDYIDAAFDYAIEELTDSDEDPLTGATRSNRKKRRDSADEDEFEPDPTKTWAIGPTDDK